MSNIPDDLKYASTHEWIRVNENGVATVGISDHAQDALGDIVFVDLPEIIEVNGVLAEAPETVNSDPYENGWFLKMTISDAAELDELMDADAYSDHCDEE